MYQYNQRTALFAYVKNPFGSFEATFKGLYVLNHDKSKETMILTYDCIPNMTPTYYLGNVKQPIRIAEAYNSDGYKLAHLYTKIK